LGFLTVLLYPPLQAELPPQGKLKIGGEDGFLPYSATAELMASAMSGPPPAEEINGLRNRYIDRFLPPRRKPAPDTEERRRRVEVDFLHCPIQDLSIPDPDQ
jgi:hypothetical protein